MKAIIVGADWYGEWAKDVLSAFREIGLDADIIYTNTVFGRGSGSNDVAARANLEKFKDFFRNHARFFFDLVKKIRRKLAERALARRIKSLYDPREEMLVLFVWTPPSAGLLKSLSKKNKIKLILWQGEAPPRNPAWAPSFPFFHHIFSVDEEWLPLFSGQIQGKLSYLPLASNPAKFYPLEGKEDKFSSDIVFIGHYAPERAQALSVLADRDLKIYGYGWEKGINRFPWLADKYRGPISNEDANLAFNNGKIQIGRLSVPVPYGNTVTQRVFDAALAKNFQLSEYSEAIERIFGDSVVMFRDARDLRKLADHYLARPEERRRLAEKAHDIAIKDHTYANRVQEILKAANEILRAEDSYSHRRT